jgi:hypothetical protein
MRKTLKVLHLLAASGFIGAFCVALTAVFDAPESAQSAAAVHQLLALAVRWIVLPSLAVLALTGLLAIAVHRPFIDAGWVWIKALVGMTAAGVVLINALSALDQAAAAAAASGAPIGVLEPLLRSERMSFAINLALAGLATVLGVWRTQNFTPARLTREAPRSR